jgi:hypothetical protein
MLMHHRPASVSRSRRTCALRAIGALILVGALVTSAVTVGLGFRGSSCTLTGSTSAGQGGDARTVSVCARYSVSLAGQVRIHSVQAVLRAAAGYWAPRFTLRLINGATGTLDDRLVEPTVSLGPNPVYTSQFTSFRGPDRDGSFALGETMVIRLKVRTWGPDRAYDAALASLPFVLTRPGSSWSNPGTAGSGDFSGSWVDWIARLPRRRVRFLLA